MSNNPPVTAEARVRMISRAWDSRLEDGSIPGLGEVIDELDGGDLRGERVLVPALIVVEGDPPTMLSPLLGATTKTAPGSPVEVVCPTRWLAPLRGGLAALSPAAGAVASRPLVDAYALVIAANLAEDAPAAVAGEGVLAELVRKVLRWRGQPVVELDTDSATLPPEAAVLVASDNEKTVAKAVEHARRATAKLALATAACAVLDSEDGWQVIAGGHPDLITEAAALIARGCVDVSDVPRNNDAGADAYIEIF